MAKGSKAAGQEEFPLQVEDPQESPDGYDTVPLQEEASFRQPEYGSSVLWVDNRQSTDTALHATVMAVCSNGLVNLRVYDASDSFGHFDVHQVGHDATKSAGTWHWE